MGKRRVLSVGYPLAGGEAEYVKHLSDRSLLDADVVLFEPGFGDVSYSGDEYNGRPILSDRSSAEAPRQLSHWHSELRSSLATGKLVIVFLTKPVEFFYYTGQKQFSGTGRSRVTTNIVDSITSYAAVPHLSGVSPKTGTEVVPNGKVEFFAPFWAEFQDYCEPYEVWIEGKFSQVLLQTKTGNRVVGAALRQGQGAILFLPPFRYRRMSHPSSGKSGGKATGLTEAQWGKKLVAALIGLADVLASERAVTPPPAWVASGDYRLPQEGVLASQILEAQRRLEAVEAEKRHLEQQLIKEGSLRRLLYEQGAPLEEAILEALRLMGFSAEKYQEGESEFDAVFTSPEGRFLGEAEGRDNRAVNIDKFRQLEGNLHEDFARDDVTQHAKGVLFGNGFRLSPPAEREETFTQKCFSSAQRIKAALVRTVDLFEPARYLKSNPDPDYARRCREAIFVAEGVVAVFPPPPMVVASPQVSTREKAPTKEAEKEAS